MEVTYAGLALAGLTWVVLLLTVWGWFANLRVRGGPRPTSECLLNASIATVLLLYAEVQLLSLVPMHRPLDWLPAVHVVLLLALLAGPRPAAGPRAHRQVLRRTWDELRAWFRAIGLFPAIGVGAAAVVFFLYFLYGAYHVPALWDDLAYHIPMAIQPYQDGRVQEVLTSEPQPKFFPSGVETLWYWTLQWCRSDLLFHPVLLGFGVQLLLAIYVLARRTGAAPWAAIVAGLTISSAPIFCLLTTRGYVDIAHASSIVAVAALFAPMRPEMAVRGRTDWFWGCLALAEAVQIKYPFIALLVAFFTIGHALLLRARWRETFGGALRFAYSVRGLVALALLVAFSHTYIRNYRQHGNPMWPFHLKIAGVQVLTGLHAPTHTNYGGESTAPKPIREMSRAEVYYWAWTDLRAPLNIESFGSFGLVLPGGLVMPAAAFMLASLYRRKAWPLTLSVTILAILLLTPSAPPRYGIPVVSLIAVCALCLLSELPRGYTQGCAAALLLLSAPGPLRIYKEARPWLHQYRIEQGGGPLSLLQRNYYFHEKYEVGLNTFHSLPMIRYIRQNCGKGDLLVWNINTFHTLLYNRDWTNRVLYVPGAPQENWWVDTPVSFYPMSDDDVQNWIRTVQGLQPRFVLLYQESRHGQALRDPQYGFRVALEDPPERGQWRTVLFERMPDGPEPPAALPEADPATAEAPPAG